MYINIYLLLKILLCCLHSSSKPHTTTTVLPAKSDSDVMFCLQGDQGLRIDRSLCIDPIHRMGLIHK